MLTQTDTPPPMTGYCPRCHTTHTLTAGSTKQTALQLLKRLTRQGNIDIFSSSPKSLPDLALETLFGDARGKMFGILEVEHKKGEKRFLYAFSGQYNGHWTVSGWAPPPFSIKEFSAIHDDVEKQIKILGKELALLSKETEQWRSLKKKQRELSRNLNRALQQLCRLNNFRGRETGLEEIFDKKGIPTGTGECCTPKLLNYAAQNRLKPLGICEFFIGRETRSQSCEHGKFYAPCLSKCQPLLGFMLCGIEEMHQY